MLLLDTQILIWAAYEPDRLKPATRRLLAQREQAVLFSYASLWEVGIKSSLGRPDFQVDVASLHQGLLAAGFDALAIEPEHLFAVAKLPWHHRDPFDRLLVAQAQVDGISLLSGDATLRRYGRMVKAA